ncbi:unnamed protein product [Rotaria sp. Silwood2]|nr:unnamed protein product [Rotaria sp. Silwood2]CAF2825829.1 unnamed protein product [Rotaria sp. Silwood2]CAF3133290.1 unnamed protein product [Rotaria sp. Silwood2]CAF3202733.1 unnamed protein product [Rotaria sp. Silwood2]CAF3996262.1 unnamed protein product [Rotaria sp. Silwood2]
MNSRFITVATIANSQLSWTSSYFDQKTDASSQGYGWKVVGDTYDEQVRLRNMATMVAAWPKAAEDNVPTVPCLSADGHMLVLSASASRVRYGVSATFIMVFHSDVIAVLPKKKLAQPIPTLRLSLWCIFDDGSVTPAYSFDVSRYHERVSLLDCPLSMFASDQLWRYNRTLRVYVASTTDKDRNVPILKAFITVPTPSLLLSNSSQESLTLCTSPLHNGAEYLTEWIEFHRLVGFRKFAIYNTTDTHQRLSSVVNAINRKYSNLVDVIQWNFSSLALADVSSVGYFQMEALHDCLIRYGDQSEWLGMFDLNEYIVPRDPCQTVLDCLHDNYRRRVIGSISLMSYFFCSKESARYALKEKDTNRLVIERFVFYARDRQELWSDKYLHRPRFVHYLSNHHEAIGIPTELPSRDRILLAHYVSITQPRNISACSTSEQNMTDTSIRDRFAKKVKDGIKNLII